MEFDRNAIGSLEDVRREWDSLEDERSKVEEKLRNFDGAAGRGRGGGGFGLRGGGRGVGGRGRVIGLGDRGGGGGDWSRDRPRDNNTGGNGREAPQQNSYQASREKYRAMSGKWERGLDPATAALHDDDPAQQQSEGRGRGGRGGGMRGDNTNNNNVDDNSTASYQRSANSRTGGSGRDNGRAVTIRSANGGGGGGGIRGDRDTRRGDRGGIRGERYAMPGSMNGGMRGNRDIMRANRDIVRGNADLFRNGGSGRGGSKDHDYRGSGSGGGGGGGSGGGGGEPEAKRPRVTSVIVIAGDDDTTNGDGGGVGTMENGELDRWNADPTPATATAAEPAAAAAAGAAASEEKNNDDNNNDDDNVDYEPEAEPEEEVGLGGGDTSAPPPGEEESATGGGPTEEKGDEEGEGVEERRPTGKIVVVSGGGPRGRAARAGGVAGSGGMRQSLARRLGPPMGKPVMVCAAAKEGADAFVPLAERPMPEPSKPELHQAYKDGDTKKRNRRMFGGLMAHLGRARQQLDHDKTLIQRQNHAVEMAATRQQQEKRQQRQNAASAARQERDDELHKRDFIDARQKKTLVALHGNAFIANQEQLKGCIFTKALPKLAWTPNEHTDVTQALLADSNKEVDACIVARREADDREFQKLDDSVAQRAAARVSRRIGSSGNGGRQGERQDRDANPYGEGNERCWPTKSGMGEDDFGKGEESGRSGTRGKRGHESERAGDGGGDDGDDGVALPANPGDAGGGGGVEYEESAGSLANPDDAAGGVDHEPMVVEAAAEVAVMAVGEPEGREVKEEKSAEVTGGVAAEGMDVDEDGGMHNDLAENKEGGKPEESSPGHSPAPAWDKSGDANVEGGGGSRKRSDVDPGEDDEARVTGDGGGAVVEGDEHFGGVDAGARAVEADAGNGLVDAAEQGTEKAEAEEDGAEIDKLAKKKSKKKKKERRSSGGSGRKKSSRRSSSTRKHDG